MQKYIKKISDAIIGWAVPAVCAAALLLWKDVPEDVKHYWPLLVVALVALWDGIATWRNRQDIRELRAIHAAADAREEAMQQRDEVIAKAFRAMLDDSMGVIYAACVARGYTTEDERRRYARLDAAYTANGGNGEAARRKVHFNALMDEEEWKAQQKKEENTHD